MSLVWARFPSLDASSPPDAHSCASHKKVERKLGLGGRLSFTTAGSNKWRWSDCLNTRWAPPPPTTEVRLAQFCIFPATSSSPTLLGRAGGRQTFFVLTAKGKRLIPWGVTRQDIKSSNYSKLSQLCLWYFVSISPLASNSWNARERRWMAGGRQPTLQDWTSQELGCDSWLRNFQTSGTELSPWRSLIMFGPKTGISFRSYMTMLNNWGGEAFYSWLKLLPTPSCEQPVDWQTVWSNLKLRGSSQQDFALRELHSYTL